MRRLYLLGYILVIVATVACFIGIKLLNSGGNMNGQDTDSLKLTSSAFNGNDNIPAHYTCQGDNVSPPLTIAGLPAGSKSLAIIMHDPDAPSGDFTHWVIWNISPSIKQIDENSVPADSSHGTNGFGNIGYGGPCPPSGTHHYIFELYALDFRLNLPSSTGQTELKQAMQGHILDQTTLTGLFSK